MKHAAAFLFLIIMIPALPVRAEYLFMADGSIVEGTILKQKALSVTIKRRDNGRTESIHGYDILRIRQTNLWKDRRWIRSADGTLRHVFLVDENASSLLVRGELFSPAEVSLQRSDCVILDKDPPSGELAAAVSVKTAVVSWDGTSVRRVYLRRRDGDYSFSGESSSGTLTIPNLAGSAFYEAVMTGVSQDGTESTPSKSVPFRTPNTPPVPPSEISCSIADGALHLSWDGDSDEDGFVERYAVYLCDRPLVEKLAAVSRRQYVLPCDTSIPHRFSVTAIDDAGAESAQSRQILSRVVVPVRYILNPLYAFPLIGLTKDFSYGYGTELSLEICDRFVRGLGFGVSSGVLLFGGKGTVKKGDAVPLLLRCSYSYAFTSWFSLSGSLEPGGMYISSLEEGQKRVSSFIPAGHAAVCGVFALSPRVSFSLNAGTGCLFYKGAFGEYLTGGAAFSLLF